MFCGWQHCVHTCIHCFVAVFVGVSFDDSDADMDDDLSVSAEDQLQHSLDSLHDAVLKQHTLMQPPSAAASCMFFHLLT